MIFLKTGKFQSRKLIFLLLFCLLIIGNVTLYGQFSGGSGTAADPWHIDNVADLNRIRDYLGVEHADKHFEQTADIDLRNVTNWQPIGTSSLNSFRGKFDGGSYIIGNLYIDRPESSFQGLFGYTVGAELRNIGLTEINILAANNTGGLTGNQQGGSIDGCFVTGRVQGIREVGGLVGNKGGSDSSVTNSYSMVNLSGSGNRIGGIVGYNQQGTVRFCYASGYVERDDSGARQIGALIGFSAGGTVANNFWNTETTGQTKGCFNLDIPGRTAWQMMHTATYMTWDFPFTWQIEEGESFPYLSWSGEAATYNYPSDLPPQNLTVTEDDERIVINWQAGSIGEPDGYHLYRRTNDEQAERINENLLENRQYIDTDVTNNIRYTYHLTAVYGETESMPSHPVRATPFAIGGGSGTEEDPYLIATAGHLNVLRIFTGTDGNGLFFRQTADIDLADWNEGNGWTPIGDENNFFSGNYDGNNFKIENLIIFGTGSYQGLFGHAKGANFTDIKLKNVRITGAESYVGGLVGYLGEESTIIDCSVEGSISGVNYVGGLAGYQHGSVISSSFSSGSVSGFDVPSHVGGLVGYKTNIRSLIENSYSTAQVTGNQRNAGGLVGTNWNGNITKSYAVGSVYATNNDVAVGGLTGHYQTGEITDSYWNIQSTGQEESPGGGEGRTTTQMLQQATFENWDFDNVWGIDTGTAYPYLLRQGVAGIHNIPGPYGLDYEQGDTETDIVLNWEMVGTPLRYHLYLNGSRTASVNHPTREWEETNRSYFTEYTYYLTAVFEDNGEEYETGPSNNITVRIIPSFAGGSGTVLDPYRVNTAAMLRLVADSLNAHFRQTGNIDLGEYPWNSGEGWLPIGSDQAGQSFTGSFDGNGFVISNLFINRNGDFQGLFGYTQGAVLEDITLENVNVSGNQYVGGLVGYVTGEVFDCHVSGTIRAGSNYAGGLMGYGSGEFNDNSADVEISGVNYVGGLAGTLFGEAVNCRSEGYVTGTGSYLGGLVGQNRADIVLCSSTATVQSASSYVGGLAGDTHNIIVDSWSTGNVTGYRYVGGLAGMIWNDIVIRESYSTSEVFGTYREIGGLVGYSRGRIERSYATGSVTGNDRHIGGLVGYKRYGNNVISDSYAIGNVTSNSTHQDSDVGGLVGYNFDGEIRNSYSTGLVTGLSEQYAGGLVGRQEDAAFTNESFWNTESSGREASAGGSGRTTAQMFQANTFTNANWNFNDIWEIQPNRTYPYLQWQQEHSHNRPAPRSLTAQAGNNSVDLNWVAPLGADIQGYNLYRNGDLVNTEAIITEPEFQDEGLTNYRTYVYYVAAVYDAQENISSGPSNHVSAIPIRGSFTGGNGSLADPYIIDSAGALWEIRRYLGIEHSNVHFSQTVDIDLDTVPFNEGRGWQPIGDGSSAEERFYANFNGNGHAIANMRISSAGSDYAGLIAYMVNASFENVQLVNVDIQGRSFVGGITGYLNSSVINNCSVDGIIRGNTYTGGAVGFLTGVNSTTNGVYIEGEISGGAYTGGLIGYSAAANTVSNCYSTAFVSGSSFVGGLIGDSRSNVTFSYSTGLVRGTGTDVGPMAGRIGAGNIAASCFWNNETTGHLRYPGITFGGNGINTLQMIQQETYEAWDFEDIWAMEAGSYPYLRWQTEVASHNYPPPVPPSFLRGLIGNSRIVLSWVRPSLGEPLGYKVYRNNVEIAVIGPALSYRDASAANNVQYSYHLTAFYEEDQESQPSNYILAAPIAGGFAGGSGTEDDPYQVAASAQLDAVRYNPSLHYIQTANINLSGYRNWEPIGSTGAAARFSGTYDGDYYIIRNLRRANQTSYSGLFGYTDEAVLRNISVEDASWAGGSYSGIIAGYARMTEIDNCYATGSLQSTSIYIGGIVGYMVTNSSVSNCFTDVNISGTARYAGGLVGGNSGSPIRDSFALGDVTTETTTTSTYIGGLVGYNMNTITNCYASGNVTSPQATAQYIGGITGRSNGIISNSYASGTVIGNQYVGGLVGYNSSSVLNSYASGSITGTTFVGGLIGDNRSSVINSFSYGRVFAHGESVGGLIGSNTSNVTSSYWNTQTSGIFVSAGGEGRNSAEMTYPYADNTYINWNFNSIWVADIEAEVNNGYPFHIWGPITVSPNPTIASNPFPRDGAANLPLNLPRVEWDYRTSMVHEDPIGFRLYMNTTGEFDEDSHFVWIDYVQGQTRYTNSGILPEEFKYGTIYYWQVVPTTIVPDNNRSEYYSPEGRIAAQSVERRARIRRGLQGSTNDRTVLCPGTYLNLRGDAANSPVWTFSTLPVPRPLAATDPDPEDEAEDVPISLTQLSWKYESDPLYRNPVGFRVYLDITDDFDDHYIWVEYNPEETVFSAEIDELLDLATTYYWQVIPTTIAPDNSRIAVYSPKRRIGAKGEEHREKGVRNDAEDCPVWRFTTQTEVHIETDELFPAVTKLTGNYPNPFNPETTILFSLAEESTVTLNIYNIRGQLVRRLLADNLDNGEHKVVWDGRDDNHRSVGTGVYYYMMKSGSYTSTKNMVLIK